MNTAFKPYLIAGLLILAFITLLIIVFKIIKGKRRNSKKEILKPKRPIHTDNSKKSRCFASAFWGCLFCLIGITAPAIIFSVKPGIVKFFFAVEAIFILLGIIFLFISEKAKEKENRKTKQHIIIFIIAFAVISSVVWFYAININNKRFANLNGNYLPVGETTKLTADNLYKEKKAITSLDELEKLTKVDTVDIGNAGISDLSVLTRLTNLKTVSAENNSIADISPLVNLKHLSTLNLQYNCINDISPLAKCKELNELVLCGNPIEDFSPLFEIKTLNYIDLRDTYITQDDYFNLKVTFPDCLILIDF